MPLVGWEERIGAGREVSFSRESLKRRTYIKQSTGLVLQVKYIWTVSLFLLFLKWGCRVATFYRVAIDM